MQPNNHTDFIKYGPENEKFRGEFIKRKTIQ